MSVHNTPDTCNGKRTEDTNTRPPQENIMPRTADISKMATKGSPRFGALSHHSFFSRHNPHPNRVNHFQGLNGAPVCMVNDDWYMASLFPHPLIQSQVFRTATGAPFSMTFRRSWCGGNRTSHRKALLSEAWKEELKDLAARVSICSQAKKERKDEKQEDGIDLVRRKTQYSAQTGRIIPPSTKVYQRQPKTHPHPSDPPLHDQELMVLELLCQILQTDSLSVVQQWLLLSGQQEKDLVKGLIQQAMEESIFPGPQQSLGEMVTARCTSRSTQSARRLNTSGTAGLRLKQRLHTCSLLHKEPVMLEDIPERIGEAEVLEIHSEPQKPPEIDLCPQVDQSNQVNQDN
ncbi:hypothetical protein UPYG_G00131340 [Umbra pygmaea]|uniref:Thymus, brain and testes associated n=1 Tax=Umbra pygmaea TaxID=75934 RepID=A0ABD0WT67_UMBPY